MKKEIFAFSLVILSVFMLALANAEQCTLGVTLLNQDPYPAVPGDYVKLVFQVTGAENPSCGVIKFNLPDQYPLSFDSNVSTEVKYDSGTFVKDYSGSLLIPYKVRIDKNAIEGDNTIKFIYSLNSETQNSYQVETQFNINIKELGTKFEAYVKNFDFNTNMLTIQILNSGKSNIDALTIEIPEQNVTVKGSNRNIVGALDANEYTTTDFEVTPKETDIKLNLYYTDKIGVRRSTETTIHFDPVNFQGRKAQQQSSSTWIYILVVVVLVVIYIFYRKYKKNQKKKLHS